MIDWFQNCEGMSKSFPELVAKTIKLDNQEILIRTQKDRNVVFAFKFE